MTQAQKNSTTLFVEIRTEDLPPLAESNLFFNVFDRSLSAALQKHGCEPVKEQSEMEKMESVNTPRRFACFTPLSTPERVRRGPSLANAYTKDNRPTAMLEGFLRSQGAREENLVKDCVYKGRKYVGLKYRLDLRKQIGTIIEEAIEGAILPRKMRWISENGDPYKFVRRITGAMVYVGGNFVATEIFGIATSKEIGKHRFFAPSKPTVLGEQANWEDYLKLLEKSGVMGKAVDREIAIKSATKDYRQVRGASYDELIKQLVQMCEYPAPIECSFNKKYLKLPTAVIKEVGNKHLRVFTNLGGGKAGKRNGFLFIADRYKPAKRLKDQIKRGVERVMEARLDDALFLYEQDKSTPEIEKVLRKKIDSVTYIYGLGTIAGRCERICKLAKKTSSVLGLSTAETDMVTKAASLCKLDFGTQTVGELPSLEGKIIGGLLNLHEDVSTLLETYTERELDETSSLPRACLVIAHELERLAANVAVLDRRITGYGDPSGIRRSINRVREVLIQGAGSIDLHSAKDFDLFELIGYALDLVANDVEKLVLKNGETKAVRFDSARRYLCLQFRDAFHRGYFTNFAVEGPDGIKALNLISDLGLAVFNIGAEITEDSSLMFYESDMRSRALLDYLRLSRNKFLEIGRIIKRLTKIWERTKGFADLVPKEVNVDLLQDESEQMLYEESIGLKNGFEEYEKQREYKKMLDEAYEVVPAVDSFFDSVMVEVPDEALKLNRFALVRLTTSQMYRWALPKNQ